MHAPAKVRVNSLADYLEAMSKSVFQTGISWKVVDAKWPGTKEAFKAFDPQAISRLRPSDVDKLVEDKRVIRNRRKIEAIVANAHQMLLLDGEHAGFRHYLRSFGSFDELVKDLKSKFKFLGDMGAYHFLWVVGEEVPPWEEWSAQHMARP